MYVQGVAFGAKQTSQSLLKATNWYSLTRLYGPAVRCKRVRRARRWAVLHQCIRPLVGALRSGPSWISARVRSH